MDQNKDFKPYVPAEKITPEITVTSVIMGILLAVIFGAANAYLGLRVGMTVSASIPAAVIAMVLSLFDVAPWVQLIVFLLVGLALVVATRPLCRKFLTVKEEKTNVDALVGKVCIVTEEICNIEERGEVKLSGLCWSARAADGRVIAVGEQVTVKEIQGVKLIVE